MVCSTCGEKGHNSRTCPTDMEPTLKRPKLAGNDGVRRAEKKCGCAPCLCGHPAADSTGSPLPTLRTHEMNVDGAVRERKKRSGAVMVDPLSGRIVPAPPQPRLVVGPDGKAARAAHNPFRLCPHRWFLQPDGVPLLDGSLATSCKAMAAAGVPDPAVDAIYMPSSAALTDTYSGRFSSVYTTEHRQHTETARVVSAATPHVAYSSGEAGRGEILTPATAALLAYDDAYDGEVYDENDVPEVSGEVSEEDRDLLNYASWTPNPTTQYGKGGDVRSSVSTGLAPLPTSLPGSVGASSVHSTASTKLHLTHSGQAPSPPPLCGHVSAAPFTGGIQHGLASSLGSSGGGRLLPLAPRPAHPISVDAHAPATGIRTATAVEPEIKVFASEAFNKPFVVKLPVNATAAPAAQATAPVAATVTGAPQHAAVIDQSKASVSDDDDGLSAFDANEIIPGPQPSKAASNAYAALAASVPSRLSLSDPQLLVGAMTPQQHYKPSSLVTAQNHSLGLTGMVNAACPPTNGSCPSTIGSLPESLSGCPHSSSLGPTPVGFIFGGEGAESKALVLEGAHSRRLSGFDVASVETC